MIAFATFLLAAFLAAAQGAPARRSAGAAAAVNPPELVPGWLSSYYHFDNQDRVICKHYDLWSSGDQTARTPTIAEFQAQSTQGTAMPVFKENVHDDWLNQGWDDPAGGSRTGIANWPSASGDLRFASLHTTYYTAPESGVYEFLVQSDDGSMLYIDEQLVVKNDYPHGADSVAPGCVELYGDCSMSNSMRLVAGRTYTIQVAYFECGGAESLTAQVRLASTTGWQVLVGTTTPPATSTVTAVIASDAIIGGTAGAVCYDLPLFDGNAWADLDGDGCSSYTARSWCDAVGNEGDGWGLGGDTMEDFAVSGLSAAKACCGCGGGFQPDRLPTDGDGKGPTQDESDAAVAIADLLTCSECPTEANLVCASDQTFFNPCFAQCTNHPTFQGGVCASSVVEAGGNDGSPSGQLPIIVGCPSDATAHFTSRGMKKLKKAIKTRIGKRLKKLSAAECAQICVDLVECLSFEYFINKKQCDIYAGSAATIGMKRAFKKSTVQEHYERSLFCRGPRTAEG